MLTISAKLLTIGAELLTIGAKLLTILAYGVLHITTMLPICAIIIRKRQRQHYRKHYKETVADLRWDNDGTVER